MHEAPFKHLALASERAEVACLAPGQQVEQPHANRWRKTGKKSCDGSNRRFEATARVSVPPIASINARGQSVRWAPNSTKGNHETHHPDLARLPLTLSSRACQAHSEQAPRCLAGDEANPSTTESPSPAPEVSESPSPTPSETTDTDAPDLTVESTEDIQVIDDLQVAEDIQESEETPPELEVE